MIANYHTHTWRCNHAHGVEKQYIEKAIGQGLQILGFSDHTPYCFPNGYIGPDKMLPSQLEDYVDTVLRLRDQYRGDIEIHLGLEAEYYPEIWEGLLKLIEPYPIEYLLLGSTTSTTNMRGTATTANPATATRTCFSIAANAKKPWRPGDSSTLPTPTSSTTAETLPSTSRR